MTQEQKDLLLKDLCARLPYGVIVNVKGFDYDYNSKLTQIYNGVGCSIQVTTNIPYDIEQVKPYLFPLSSMTERQCYELSSIRSSFQDCWKYIKTPIPLSICNFEQIEWFHKNHFDYRGLIPMGMAIDATGKNIY